MFSLEEGTYGKSILNNSSIKTFFALEEENIKILSEYANLSEKEVTRSALDAIIRVINRDKGKELYER